MSAAAKEARRQQIATFRALTQSCEPRESWWLQAPRDRWADLVAAQTHRMRGTPFGLQVGCGVTAKDDPSLHDRRQRREVTE